MTDRILVAALAALAVTIGGCGYALVGRAANLPEHVEAIYVSPLENETRRSEVEQILTRAITEELVTRRRFELTSSVEEADAILEGAVTEFSVTPLAFDDEGSATEYQIRINARMAFVDRVEDVVLWENAAYVYTEAYPVERSEAGYFDREKLAIEDAAGNFARTLVIDLLEGF